MGSMEEQIGPIFEGMLNFNLMFTEEVFNSQEKLKELLDELNGKLSRIEESGDLNRDCEIASYVEKIASQKKRLENLNKTLLVIQSRVDKIETRYIQYKKKNQPQI